MKQCIPTLLFILSIPLMILSQSIESSIDSYINSYVNAGDFSGCILISSHDNEIFKSCYGKANYETNVDNQYSTQFKIGSISKQFTAVAILILEEKGLMNTSDKLSKYFPNYKYGGEITIEHLLTHRSGIKDIYNIDGFNKMTSSGTSFHILTDSLLNAPLQFEPGSQFTYSNGGYAVAARIIEEVSGLNYGSFLKQYIFDPLGLNNTKHELLNTNNTQLAKGYEPLGFKDRKETIAVNPDLLKGSGSLVSTVSDLNKWIISLKEKSLLTPQSYHKFFNNYGSNYGLGLSIYTVLGYEVFGHDGRINGFISDYLHYKKDDITIIISGNIQTGISDFLREDLARIVFNKTWESRAKELVPLNDTKAHFEHLLGSYSFGPNFVVYIENENGLLTARANEGSSSEIIPLSDGRFFNRTLYSFLEFEAYHGLPNGKLLWINNDGNAFEGIMQ